MRLLLAVVAALAPLSTSAHAFGVAYDLPLPTSFYIAGGVFALVVSFLLLLASPPAAEDEFSPRMLIGAPGATRLFAAIRVALALGFVLTVVIGLAGDPSSAQNAAPLLFWIFFLLGFAYAAVFVQGLWEQVNPVARLLEFLPERPPRFVLPSWAHHLPALALYILLIFAELLTEGAGADPRFVAGGLLAYLSLSLLAAVAFGRGVWREHIDPFGLFFRTIGTLAPVVAGADGIRLRFPLRAVVKEEAPSAGFVAFVTTFLAFTAFDGFRETAPYAAFTMPLSRVLGGPVTDLFLFAAFPLLFLAVFAAAADLARRISDISLRLDRILRAYAYSLIPIAIAYHVAHYFTLLLVEGQRMVTFLSDPLGRGWDLLGTATFAPSPGIIGADTVWYIQLSVIVVGHIVALYLSHAVTRRLVPDRRCAVLAELPFVALMVLYTAFGLWLLSRPFAL